MTDRGAELHGGAAPSSYLRLAHPAPGTPQRNAFRGARAHPRGALVNLGAGWVIQGCWLERRGWRVGAGARGGCRFSGDGMQV